MRRTAQRADSGKCTRGQAIRVRNGFICFAAKISLGRMGSYWVRKVTMTRLTIRCASSLHHQHLTPLGGRPCLRMAWSTDYPENHQLLIQSVSQEKVIGHERTLQVEGQKLEDGEMTLETR